jgi:hypothetical protein
MTRNSLNINLFIEYLASKAIAIASSEAYGPFERIVLFFEGPRLASKEARSYAGNSNEEPFDIRTFTNQIQQEVDFFHTEWIANTGNSDIANITPELVFAHADGEFEMAKFSESLLNSKVVFFSVDQDSFLLCSMRWEVYIKNDSTVYHGFFSRSRGQPQQFTLLPVIKLALWELLALVLCKTDYTRSYISISSCKALFIDIKWREICNKLDFWNELRTVFIETMQRVAVALNNGETRSKHKNSLKRPLSATSVVLEGTQLQHGSVVGYKNHHHRHRSILNPSGPPYRLPKTQTVYIINKKWIETNWHRMNIEAFMCYAATNDPSSLYNANNDQFPIEWYDVTVQEERNKSLQYMHRPGNHGFECLCKASTAQFSPSQCIIYNYMSTYRYIQNIDEILAGFNVEYNCNWIENVDKDAQIVFFNMVRKPDVSERSIGVVTTPKNFRLPLIKLTTLNSTGEEVPLPTADVWAQTPFIRQFEIFLKQGRHPEKCQVENLLSPLYAKANDVVHKNKKTFRNLDKLNNNF